MNWRASTIRAFRVRLWTSRYTSATVLARSLAFPGLGDEAVISRMVVLATRLVFTLAASASTTPV